MSETPLAEPELAQTPPADSTESSLNLGRIAWAVTAFVCLLTAVIVLFQGYVGYAGVTFAVAIAAGINLF